MIAQAHFSPPQRSRLVLASSDSAHAALVSRQFRRLGWEVHLVNSGPEARRLARALAPQAVVLDIELREESGWLTCAKLALEHPALRIVLLSPQPTPEQRRFAEVAGGTALVQRGRGLSDLVGEVQGTTLAAAG